MQQFNIVQHYKKKKKKEMKTQAEKCKENKAEGVGYNVL